MASPDDAIYEDPDRFTNKLKFEKIQKSKNPQKEFLKQMEKRWNQKGGLYLWKYFVEKYDLINAVYNSKSIQSKVPESFKGNLDKNITKDYFNNFLKKSANYQSMIEKRIANSRAEGKTISPHKYSDIQKRFILIKKEMPLRFLSSEFNRNFGTKLTRNAIRDKRLRLLGTKK